MNLKYISNKLINSLFPKSISDKIFRFYDKKRITKEKSKLFLIQQIKAKAFENNQINLFAEDKFNNAAYQIAKSINKFGIICNLNNDRVMGVSIKDNCISCSFEQFKIEFAYRLDPFLDFFVGRFLFYFGLITFEMLFKKTNHLFKEFSNKICISLPEYPKRRHFIESQCIDDLSIFDGILHPLGWVGCAYSYKYLGMLNKNKSKWILIMEDDAEIKTEYKDYINNFIDYAAKENIDVLSGFSSVISKANHVSSIIKQSNKYYVLNLKFTVSTVFNIYSPKSLELISKWEFRNNFNSRFDQIDQFLKNKCENLKYSIVYPFIVNHREDIDSTIFNKNNKTIYKNMENKSCKYLESILSSKFK